MMSDYLLTDYVFSLPFADNYFSTHPYSKSAHFLSLMFTLIFLNVEFDP